jgi:protein-S-isoprenylcysteine O-methyltransferase Ste14
MRTQAQVLVMLQLVLFALLAGALFLLPAEQGVALRLVGLGLTGVGLLLVMLSILTHTWINRSLVNVSPEPNRNNQLVQTGIYAYIRHPIYTGVMLAALGTALAHGHSVPLIIALVLCVFFTYKSIFEERWLVQVYPEYAAYRQRAGRFLPRLLG